MCVKRGGIQCSNSSLEGSVSPVSRTLRSHCGHPLCSAQDLSLVETRLQTGRIQVVSTLPPWRVTGEPATDLPSLISPPRELTLTPEPILGHFSGLFPGLLCWIVLLLCDLTGLESREAMCSFLCFQESLWVWQLPHRPLQRFRLSGWYGSVSSLTWAPLPGEGPDGP